MRAYIISIRYSSSRVSLPVPVEGNDKEVAEGSMEVPIKWLMQASHVCDFFIRVNDQRAEDAARYLQRVVKLFGPEKRMSPDDPENIGHVAATLISWAGLYPGGLFRMRATL